MIAVSSRERLLEALACRQPDRVPCSFMLYKALQETSRDLYDYVERQLALGLDAYVALPVRSMRRPCPMPDLGNLRGLPVHFPPDVLVRDWREDTMLHREYLTLAGLLRTTVEISDDFTHSDRIALFDDFVIPRGRKRLVAGEQDLPALRHLLAEPAAADIRAFREEAQVARAFADRHGLPVVGEWGVLFDAACWLCGMQEISMLMLEQPEFVEELFAIVGAWNRRRMEVILDEGVDLFIKRAWYENAEFLSPELYRRFILPIAKQDAQTVHEAGARFGCITTSAYTPFLDLYLESGLDALIGLDPLQDPQADFAYTKQKLAGKVCLWGGVNGCITVEMGTSQDVRDAVEQALAVLAPGGGFILSPVDNLLKNDATTRSNVNTFIEAWRESRQGY